MESWIKPVLIVIIALVIYNVILKKHINRFESSADGAEEFESYESQE